MVMHSPHGRAATGFTLVEMMVALSILVFGLTALVGVLGVGVDTRRSSERLTRASSLVDRVVHRIENEILPSHLDALGYDVLDAASLAIPSVEQAEVPGYQGLSYTVEFVVDETLPELVLAMIKIHWREQGAEQAEEFPRVFRRAAPLSVRRALAELEAR